MGRILGVQTSDAVSVIQVGDLVIKHYREANYIWRTPEKWRQQIRRRIAFTRNPPDLGAAWRVNPTLFWHWPLVFAPYVEGRLASRNASNEFQRRLQVAGWGKCICDINPANIIDTNTGFVLIDFVVWDLEPEITRLDDWALDLDLPM